MKKVLAWILYPFMVAVKFVQWWVWLPAIFFSKRFDGVPVPKRIRYYLLGFGDIFNAKWWSEMEVDLQRKLEAAEQEIARLQERLRQQDDELRKRGDG